MRRYGLAMPTGPRKLVGPGPVWERGIRVKFHYTQPDFAELILAEQTYRVSAQEGRAGHGLYVTSARPGSMSDKDLLSLLFTRPRPALFVDGVVVLRDDAFSWSAMSRESMCTGPSLRRFWIFRWCSSELARAGGAIGCGRRASTPEPSPCYPNIRKST